MQRHALWVRRYAEIGGGQSGAHTKQDRETFPRYLVAEAMLQEVERLRPDQFSSLSEARDSVVAASGHAQTVFSDPPRGKIQAEAMDEERSAFERYILGLGEADLARVEPLPYRRVLTQEETESGFTILREIWGVNGYWYPLIAVPRADIIAFQAPYFERDVGGPMLRRMLESREVHHVSEVREYGASYEIALDLLKPEYNGAEGFWFPSDPHTPLGDWVVYASHESSLTIGGNWLIEQIKSMWPEWARHVWVSPIL